MAGAAQADNTQPLTTLNDYPDNIVIAHWVTLSGQTIDQQRECWNDVIRFPGLSIGIERVLQNDVEVGQRINVRVNSSLIVDDEVNKAGIAALVIAVAHWWSLPMVENSPDNSADRIMIALNPGVGETESDFTFSAYTPDYVPNPNA